PRGLVVDAVRIIINELRETILSLEDLSQLEDLKLEAKDLIPLVKKLVQKVTTFSQRRVINATGVVVHTNLGRSILPEEAVEAMAMAARSYTNLAYDLSQGQRGSRQTHVASLLTTPTGSEAPLVVNNNAAAVLLVLTALAQDREVIVSRGELVEIGGGFRIPEIMRQSGVRLVEVGTTNKTRIEDYQRAITSETALLLKVHT
ncbi:L-seryl-tRNA(Ser) selenium transferase, partial [Candidatus Hakubella thermalkaliphila]